jgi:hypothetical protein
MSFIQDYQGVLGILGGIIGIAVAVATYFRGVIQQNQKIHTIELQMNTMDTKFNVFWSVIEKELPKILIRPHTPEIDAYLRKMEKGESLTEDEKVDLIKRMREVLDKRDEEQDTSLKLGYAFVIARIESELATKEFQQQHHTRERKHLW